jgi:hypothetical protein
MGYRSDVTISFYTSNQSQIPFAAIKLWFDENYPVREAQDEWGVEIEAGDNYVNVWYEDVKWYDSYNHVQAVQAAIEKFVDTFEANDKDDAHYEMVRIGEDVNDIEREASAYSHYLLDVSRTIRFN